MPRGVPGRHVFVMFLVCHRQNKMLPRKNGPSQVHIAKTQPMLLSVVCQQLDQRDAAVLLLTIPRCNVRLQPYGV